MNLVAVGARENGGQEIAPRAWRLVASSNRVWWLAVLSAVVPLYLVTAHWSSGQVDDTQAAAWTAWNVAHHGSFVLDNRPAGLPDLIWFQPLGDHLVTFRSMGAILGLVPIALLLSWTGLGPEHLNALNAAIMTAATIATLSVLLRQLVHDRLAIAATAVVAFGTSLWTVAASETWPQTADALYLSLALLAVSRRRWWWAGIALAPAIATRPHLALVALVLGIGLGISERSLRAVVGIGVPSALGMAALISWNRWIFGAWSVGGAYTGHEQAMTTVPDSPAILLTWLTNAAGAFISPGVGLFLFCPVAALAGWWIVAARREAPAWAWWALLGGLAYQAVQLYLNAFQGGGGFYGNRLVIELVVLATPLAVVTYGQWSSHSARRRVLVTGLASVAVALHAIGALLSWYLVGTPAGADWTRFYPAVVVSHSGLTGVVVTTTASACAAVYVLHRLRVERVETGRTGDHRTNRPTHSGEWPARDLKAIV
jgi:hypothetical protein